MKVDKKNACNENLHWKAYLSFNLTRYLLVFNQNKWFLIIHVTQYLNVNMRAFKSRDKDGVKMLINNNTL